MTEQELKDYGYQPHNCKIGIVYFKIPFAVRLNDNVATLYDSDESEIGNANTLDELKQLEAKHYLKSLSLHRIIAAVTYGKIVEDYPDVIDKANKLFDTELEVFRKVNQTWYETNFDPAIDREKMFLDELTKKYMHMNTILK